MMRRFVRVAGVAPRRAHDTTCRPIFWYNFNAVASQIACIDPYSFGQIVHSQLPSLSICVKANEGAKLAVQVRICDEAVQLDQMTNA